LKRCKVITVMNWKGGVGKTTLTHHLGTGLLELSKNERERYLGTSDLPRVLLIDNDAQCNLSISCLEDDYFEDLVYKKGIGTMKNLYSEFLMHDESDIDVDDYILKGSVRAAEDKVYTQVDLLPAHQDLIYTDMNIAVCKKPDFQGSLVGSDIYKFQILERILEQVRDDYDFIFIDCPPDLNFITQNSLYTSDYYLIPTHLDKLSSYGISSITNKVDEINKIFYMAPSQNGYDETELVGIVGNSVVEWNQAPKQSQQAILASLREKFRDKVFENYLTYGDGIAKASELGYPVYAYAGSNGNAAKQSNMLREILLELLDRI